MRLWSALVIGSCVVVALAAATQEHAPGDVARRLVGSWRLVRYEAGAQGEPAAAIYGPNPSGRLMYDAAGRMSVHVVDPRRRKFVSDDRLVHTPEEVREAFDGYFGYFGTYTVDAAAGTVTHHIAAASFPNFAGTEQKRYFVLSGDRLELTTPPMLRGGKTVTVHVVWEREAGGTAR